MHKKIKNILFAILIFITTYKVYDYNDNYYHTTDSLPINFSTLNYLYYDHKIDLDNYKEALTKGGLIAITTQNIDNNLIYSKQPIITTLISAPYFKTYLNFHKFKYKDVQTIFEQREIYQIIGKKFASLLVAISSSILFLAIQKQFKSIKIALVSSLIYSFSTFAWATSSQANGTHHTSALLISLGYLMLITYASKKNIIFGIIISLIFTMSYIIRPGNIIYVIAGLITIILQQKQNRNRYLSYILTSLIVVVTYKQITKQLGIPFGVSNEISYSPQKLNLVYSLKVLLSITFSPNRGLFLFYPIFIISFLGMFMFVKTKKLIPIHTFSFISSIGIFGLNSIWWAWWGGFNWGPRMLTEASIPLIFFFAYFLKNYKINLFIKTSILVFFIYGVLINMIGIYTNDLSWDAKHLKSGGGVWDYKHWILPYYIQRRTISTVNIEIEDKNIKMIGRGYVFLPKSLSFIKTVESYQYFTK